MRGGRGLILGLCSDDPVLRWVGPIGLALSIGTALVVDLVGQGVGRTLVDVHADGPKLDELSPGRSGVASMPAGPIDSATLDEAVFLLARSWPAVVVRSDGKRWTGASVPYRPIYPGVLRNADTSPAVWQPTMSSSASNLRGPVMPRLSGGSTLAMLEGRRPMAKRWVRSWRRVWELPWA